jgi:hypothetical protein
LTPCLARPRSRGQRAARATASSSKIGARTHAHTAPTAIRHSAPPASGPPSASPPRALALHASAHYGALVSPQVRPRPRRARRHLLCRGGVPRRPQPLRAWGDGDWRTRRTARTGSARRALGVHRCGRAHQSALRRESSHIIEGRRDRREIEGIRVDHSFDTLVNPS